MKYMTAQLYAQINETDGADIASLYEEWEANGVAYRARLAEIGEGLPESLNQFLATMCLHDAEWRGFDVPEITPGVATVSIRQDGRAVTLYYDLLERPERTRVVADTQQTVWDATGMPLWLYDEVDVLGDPADPTGFVHEVLLSSGEVVKLTFFGFDWHVHTPALPLAANVRSGR